MLLERLNTVTIPHRGRLINLANLEAQLEKAMTAPNGSDHD